MIVRVATVVTVVLVTGATLSNAEIASVPSRPATAPASQPAGPICVAILEPEVAADLPAEERKALAGAVDALLTESLAKQKGFVLVDRQVLDKVLDERKALAAGAPKIAASNVAESLRPFWAAGVLVCPAVQHVDPKNPDGGMLVTVQAVVAQTGHLLAEAHLKPSVQRGQWKDVPGASYRLQGLWSETLRTLQQTAGLPLVEISDGPLSGPSNRLQWIADDLADSLRAAVGTESGVALLVPRQPLSTKEERLLRMMGLSAAGKNDQAAGLATSPDFRISIELEESSKTGVPFDAVAFTLTLKGIRRDRTSVSHVVKGTVGKHGEARTAAMEWLTAQLKDLAHARPADAAGDEEACRRLAQEELAIVRRLIETYKTLPPGTGIADGWSLSPLKQGLRASMARRALRASHLDPTNEEAAYVAALTVDSFYFLRGQEQSVACRERVILECQRYLDRFRKPVQSWNRTYTVLLHLGVSTAFQALSEMRDSNGTYLNSAEPERVYRYASIFLRSSIEPEVVNTREYGPGSNMWSMARTLIEALFTHCPDDRLEEEYQWWKTCWKEKVEPLGYESLPPWEYVEIGYLVRRKDVAGLHKVMEHLATTSAICHRRLWEGGNLSQPVGPEWLRRAGDPEWETWRPQVARREGVYHPVLEDWEALWPRLVPAMPPMWNTRGLPAVPVEESFSVPTEVMEYGRSARYITGQSPVELLCETPNEIWLVVPGPLRTQPVSNLRHDFRLYVREQALTAGPAQKQPPELRRVEWPEHPVFRNGNEKIPPIVVVSAGTSGKGDSSVWVGTAYHGLARFGKQGNSWDGRWYTTKDGLPGMFVAFVATCLHEGKEKLLLETRQEESSLPVFSVLDADTGQVTVLARAKPEDGSGGLWAAHMSDGKKIPLGLFGRENAPDLDLKTVKDVFKFTGKGHVFKASTSGSQGSSVLVLLDESGLARLNDVTLRADRRLLDGRAVSDTIFFDDQTMFLANPGHIITRGRHLWKVPTGPSLAGAAPYWDGQGLWGTYAGRLIAYLPDWQGRPEADRWSGPMTCPNSGWVESLVPAVKGGFWATTTNGQVYRIDPRQAVEAAEKAGMSVPTSKWRQKYEDAVLAGDWRVKACFLITKARWQDALAVLDKQPDNTLVRFYKALALARMGRGKEAADLYGKIVDDRTALPTERTVSLVNRIKVLHTTKQWQAMLDAADQFGRMFPELGAKPTGQLAWYIADARKKLAAQSQPATRPTSPSTNAATVPAR